MQKRNLGQDGLEVSAIGPAAELRLRFLPAIGRKMITLIRTAMERFQVFDTAEV